MFLSSGVVKVQVRQRGRRGARRYSLNWEVRVTIVASGNERNERAELSGTIRDISSTGAFIYLRRPPEAGMTVLVSVRLPFEKETWMNLTGTVIRVRKHTEKSGAAIKFKRTRPQFVSRSS